VVDGQRARLPVIRDDEELGVELREDVGGGFGPVFFLLLVCSDCAGLRL
jgi:hypothetical protein